MASKSVNVDEELAKAIRARRNEIGLTIEQAALKAGVSTKTWSRYEMGASIRVDKYKGLCKVLGWKAFPNDEKYLKKANRVNEYKNNKVWSKYLEQSFGEDAAIVFVVGSDILLDEINEDLNELATLPKGTHLGELSFSMILSMLPEQFLMEYDYNFVYLLKVTVEKLRRWAQMGNEIIAHTVLEEMVLYLIVEEAEFLLDEGIVDEKEWGKWIYDIFGDMDIVSCLFSERYIDEDNIYHFRHWKEKQFYCTSTE